MAGIKEGTIECAWQGCARVFLGTGDEAVQAGWRRLTNNDGYELFTCPDQRPSVQISTEEERTV